MMHVLQTKYIFDSIIISHITIWFFISHDYIYFFQFKFLASPCNLYSATAIAFVSCFVFIYMFWIIVLRQWYYVNCAAHMSIIERSISICWFGQVLSGTRTSCSLVLDRIYIYRLCMIILFIHRRIAVFVEGLSLSRVMQSICIGCKQRCSVLSLDERL